MDRRDEKESARKKFHLRNLNHLEKTRSLEHLRTRRDMLRSSKTQCLLRTLSENGLKNTIYGLDPEIKTLDTQLVVIYTEIHSILAKRKNQGKKIIIPLSEILEFKTWDLRSSPIKITTVSLNRNP